MGERKIRTMPSLRLLDPPLKTDVLIVGAGPNGLVLSAELRRRGIETVTVDKVRPVCWPEYQ
jgi:NADPH-dependent 2,4-dienoyl-CoA reductase/sulfur reductase-like enzyme